MPGGGYAEYCVAPEAQCLPVPRGLGLIEAAGAARDLLHGLDQRVRSRPARVRARTFSCMAAPAASARPRSSSPAPSARASSRPPARRRNARSASNSAPSGRSTTGGRISSRFSRRRPAGDGVDVILDMVGGPLYRDAIWGAGGRGTAGADRVSAGQQGRARPRAPDDAPPDDHRLDPAAAIGRGQGARSPGRCDEKVWPLIEAERCGR